MRKFKPSKAFKRDIYKIGISEPLVEELYLLAKDQALPEKFKDHALSGGRILGSVMSNLIYC